MALIKSVFCFSVVHKSHPNRCMKFLQNRYGSDNNDKITHHNLSRMMTNARKQTYVFRDPFVAAEDEDEIYNLLTMEVITENVYKDILE